MCKLCNKNYVGRTTSFLRQRVNEHRAMYYKLLNDPQADLLNPNDHDLTDIVWVDISLMTIVVGKRTILMILTRSLFF